MKKFICSICDKVFYRRNSVTRKVCSRECQYLYQHRFQVGENANSWKGGFISKKCSVCNKDFSNYPSIMRDRKTCSKECSKKYRSIFLVGPNSANWQGGSIEKSCEICDKKFFIIKSLDNKRRTCSKECFNEYRKIHYSGKNSHKYIRGSYINTRGYKVILMPTHPYCPKTGYMSEHRLVMENHLGRLLTKNEVIHHINGVKTDNRIENLKLYKNHSTHLRECHRYTLGRGRKRKEIYKSISKTMQECSKCHRIMQCYSVKFMLCRTCFKHKDDPI